MTNSRSVRQARWFCDTWGLHDAWTLELSSLARNTPLGEFAHRLAPLVALQGKAFGKTWEEYQWVAPDEAFLDTFDGLIARRLGVHRPKLELVQDILFRRRKAARYRDAVGQGAAATRYLNITRQERRRISERLKWVEQKKEELKQMHAFLVKACNKVDRSRPKEIPGICLLRIDGIIHNCSYIWMIASGLEQRLPAPDATGATVHDIPDDMFAQ